MVKKFLFTMDFDSTNQGRDSWVHANDKYRKDCNAKGVSEVWEALHSQTRSYKKKVIPRFSPSDLLFSSLLPTEINYKPHQFESDIGKTPPPTLYLRGVKLKAPKVLRFGP